MIGRGFLFGYGDAVYVQYPVWIWWAVVIAGLGLVCMYVVPLRGGRVPRPILTTRLNVAINWGYSRGL
jgi:hypothetical protein